MYKKLLLIILALLFPQIVFAVPPPEFIIQATSQLWQIFLLGSTFLLAFFSTGYQFFKVRMDTNKKKSVLVSGVITALILALIFAFFFNRHLQNKQVAEFTEMTSSYMEPDLDLPLVETVPEESEINVEPEPPTPAIPVALKDKGKVFIEQYYKNIGTQNLEAAYNVSTQEVSLATFKSWYKNTSAVDINKLVAITDFNYEIMVSLKEGTTTTDYQVETELQFANNQPIRIIASRVRNLSQAESSPAATTSPSSLAISNINFTKLQTQKSTDLTILDARENIEYENGHMPNSTHIRFADLQAGDYQQLSKDHEIVVLCWSGIRGREVAEFLKTKDFKVRYLEEGANGWVASGGNWDGNIKFAQKYTDDRYRLVLTTDQAKSHVNEGAILVDSREPATFSSKKISGSYSIPLMYTPTSQITSAFGQLPAAPRKVITICDGYVNCFDAKLTGVELEKRGYEFVGRYNHPWEF